MHTRDLLTAQIEVFGKLLAALLLRRKNNSLTNLETELFELSKHQLGIEVEALLKEDDASFEQTILLNQAIAPEKKKLLAWLLQEHCELKMALDDFQQARNSAYKALLLYRYLLDQQNGLVYDLDLAFRYNFLKKILERQ